MPWEKFCINLLKAGGLTNVDGQGPHPTYKNEVVNSGNKSLNAINSINILRQGGRLYHASSGRIAVLNRTASMLTERLVHMGRWSWRLRIGETPSPASDGM